jgi:hypothetical protein
MNERLAEFLMWLVRDPERLEAFNDDDAARSTMVRQADLSDAEREALLSGDSTAILALLQAGTDEGLTWVAIPGIKDGIPRIKFTVGFAVFGIKGSPPITQAASARTSKTAKTATRAKGSVRAGTKRRSASSKSKSARSAKSRSAAKRRR